MDFRTNDRNYYYGILSVSQQSQSTDANTSTLAYSLTLYAGNTWFSGYTIGYRVRINGVQVAYHDNSGNQTSMSPNTSKLVTSGTTTVLHNDDGTKTVAVEAEIWTDNSSGLPVYLSCSGEMELTQILRESTISATDANIGATAMIAVNRRSSAYTHSIGFSFGSLSGYLLADGTITDTETKLTATYIGWTLPTSFYAQIPNAKSALVTLTCKTYNGDSQLGNSKTATFRATASEEECAPSVSGTVEDANVTTISLTGDASKLVRFYSSALCTITAAAKNSASLSSKRIAGTAVTGNTRTIQNVESGSFAFSATDSRGYTSTATVSATLVPYVKLTARAEAERIGTASGKVKLTISGSYFNGSFGAATNALTVKYRIDGGTWATLTATISENAYTAETTLTGVSYNAAHTLEVVVADKLATVTINGEIKRGIPVFDWGEDDFEFHVPALCPCASVSLTGGTDGAGKAGYVRVANIRIADGYVDAPIVMDVARRSDGEIYRIKLLFESVDGTDPSLLTFTASGGLSAFANKSSSGEWDIYVQKAAEDDSIAVLSLRYNLLHMRDSMIIDCNLDGYLSSKPSGAVEASSGGDYILDAGITAKTGITWTWRKYASGIAMCWGICDQVTADVTTAWGSATYVPGSSGGQAGPFDLPFDFTESRCWPTPVQSNGDFWLATWWSPDQTKQTPGYQPVRGTSKTGLNYRIALLVIGRWKSA